MVEVVAAASGRDWLAGLPAALHAQRHLIEQLLDWCEATALVTSLSVGCSLGRGAGDALSDVDAAIGVAAVPGAAGAGAVAAVEEAVVADLPRWGRVVDVLDQQVGPLDRVIRRLFAQYASGTQLDLAVMAEPEVRRGRRGVPAR